MSRELKKEIHNLQKEKTELLVLIDTLQRALRCAESVLEDNEQFDYVFTQSAKWSMNWRENK